MVLDLDKIQIHESTTSVTANSYSGKTFDELFHHELNSEFEQIFGNVEGNEPPVDRIVQVGREEGKLLTDKTYVVSFRGRIIVIPSVAGNKMGHIINDNDRALEDLIQVTLEIRHDANKVAIKSNDTREDSLGDEVREMFLSF